MRGRAGTLEVRSRSGVRRRRGDADARAAQAFQRRVAALTAAVPSGVPGAAAAAASAAAAAAAPAATAAAAAAAAAGAGGGGANAGPAPA